MPNIVIAKSAFGIEHAGEEISKAGFSSLVRLGASGQKGANAGAKGIRGVNAVQDSTKVAAGPKDIMRDVRVAQARVKSVNPPIKLGTGKELVPYKAPPSVPKPRPSGFKGAGTPNTPKPALSSVPKIKTPGRLSSGAKGFKTGFKTGTVPNATRSGVTSGRLAPLTGSQKASQTGARVGAKIKNAPSAAKGKFVATGRKVSSSVKGRTIRVSNATRDKLAAGKQKGKLVALKADMKARNAASSARGAVRGAKTSAKESASRTAQKGRLVALKGGMKARNAAAGAKGNARAVGNAARNAAGNAAQKGKLVALKTDMKVRGAKSVRSENKAANAASKKRVAAVENAPKKVNVAAPKKDVSPGAALLAGGALVGAGAGGAALANRRKQEQ